MQYLQKKKRLLAFLAVAIAIAAVFLWQRSGKAKIVIDNQSGQTLRSLTVALDGAEHALGDIPAGQSRSLSVDFRRDAKMQMRGRLADGTRLRLSNVRLAGDENPILAPLSHGGFGASRHITIGLGGAVNVK